MVNEKPHLVMDSREDEKRREAASRRDAYTFEVVNNMDAADAIMYYGGFPQVAVEFKTILDFAQDAGKDLWRKLETIAEYPYPFLVLQGGMNEAARQQSPRWRYNRKEWEIAKAKADAAILSILERRSVAILFVEDEVDYAYWLSKMAKRLGRDMKAYERPIETRKPPKRTLAEEQEDVVCAMSGVGRKAGRTLLETFKTPRALAEADASTIMDIKGFGKKSAEHIERVFNEPYPEPQD